MWSISSRQRYNKTRIDEFFNRYAGGEDARALCLELFTKRDNAKMSEKRVTEFMGWINSPAEVIAKWREKGNWRAPLRSRFLEASRKRALSLTNMAVECVRAEEDKKERARLLLQAARLMADITSDDKAAVAAKPLPALIRDQLNKRPAIKVAKDSEVRDNIVSVNNDTSHHGGLDEHPDQARRDARRRDSH